MPRLASSLLLALALLPGLSAAATAPTHPTPFASGGAACAEGHPDTYGCVAAVAFAQVPCGESGCQTRFDIDLALQWNTCASLTVTERYSWGGNYTVPVAYADQTCAGEAWGEPATFHFERAFGNAPFLWTLEGQTGFDPKYDFTLCAGVRGSFSFTRECTTWTHEVYLPSNYY